MKNTFTDVAVASQQQQGITFTIGAAMTIAGVFSIPLLGNGAHNILLGLPIILLLFTRQIRSYAALLRSNSTALTATGLFLLLAISVGWADAPAKYSFKMLSKYREFLFIPLFMLYFAEPACRKYAFRTLYLALGLSLFFSYMIHYDLVHFWDNKHSISNRIFHGISMAFFSYMSLQLAFNGKKFRPIFLLIYAIILHNLFFIENGRTGYLLILALAGLFCWQQWKLKGVATAFALGAIAFLLAYLTIDLNQLRLVGNKDLLNGETPLTLEMLQQVDIRLEYYVVSAQAFLQHWISGCGLGDFPTVYQAQFNSLTTFWEPTVNAHNEFLQIGVQTGIVGLLLFCAFLLTMLKPSAEKPLQQRQYQVAVMITVIIACFFNSSFMDHGDGVFFMILIALFAGLPWKGMTAKA